MEHVGLKEHSEPPLAGAPLSPLPKFLGSKMPLDWLKIGLNLAEKITLLFLIIILESQFGNPVLTLQILAT